MVTRIIIFLKSQKVSRDLLKDCSGNAEKLKSVINDIAGRIPMELTKNWGWDFLIQDLSNYTCELCKLPLPKIMDFLSNAYKIDWFSGDDLNDFLLKMNMGYSLEIKDWCGYPHWNLRTFVSSRVESVKETESHVKDICDQTLGYLVQATKHLADPTSDRDRKDAIADCLSAMESLLKKLSGEEDIRAAIEKLRSNPKYSNNILKEGESLWDKMNRYPDIRHGNPKRSEISEPEALYWVDRISCYVRYLSRTHNQTI